MQVSLRHVFIDVAVGEPRAATTDADATSIAINPMAAGDIQPDQFELQIGLYARRHVDDAL